MAKNRFSNQKKSNWSSVFRYGHSSMLISNKGRKPTTEKAVIWLKNLLKSTKNPKKRNFIISVCRHGKMPTKKQKDILIQILNNGK